SLYEGIKQSVVLARDHKGKDEVVSNNKYLVGYYVSELKLDEDDILNYLRARLPEYMVPSILVYLNELPLTINGKLDRKALPDPEFGSRENYVAPRNEIEQKVCRIWSEVLGLAEDKIGIRDDFFRLGGDSIVSIQLVSRLRQRLELPVSIKDIFTYKNIERLYDNVLSKSIKANNKLVIKSEQGVLDGEVPLLPIQEWFFKSRFEYFNHWNQSFLLKTSALDLERLRDSIGRLIHHHDGFRLRYKKDQELQRAIDDLIVDNNCIQYYDSNAKIEELKVLDIRTLESQEGSRKFEIKLQNILTEWQSNFNIGEGPTYSVGYIYGYEDGSARVYFALHHLIVDAVSWRIIGEDLRNLYDGKDLGRKGSSYRQWINAVRDYEQAHRNEKEYWENILVDCNQKGLEELVVGQDTVYASLELDQEKTKELLQQSNRAYNTQVNDLLLTALGYALSEVSGNRTNHIVLEGHGREEIDSTIDITRTVGWFTTMYPVRLEIREELDFSIKNIKEMVRQVPNKGVGYGAIIGYKDKTILPKVSFNYLGQFDKEDREILEEYSDGEVNRLWVITNENSGISVDFRNQDYNIININGLVIEGSLQFSIASKLGQNITDKIAKIFKQKL
ncbi:MAG: gramicidin biosynthesis protein, partial [Alphaproteobacteria bacterium]|nr:gramicidin biosynthesis protein [Alphaproteobacteria bacterium]